MKKISMNVVFSKIIVLTLLLLPILSYSKILIIYTGGTIGSKETPEGLVPTGLKEFQKYTISAANAKVNPGVDVDGECSDKMCSGTITLKTSDGDRQVEYDMISPTILDSSNATPNDWITILKSIISPRKERLEYNGFVVLQGTDTLAWTSSALGYLASYEHKNTFDIPVVVTGAQYPMMYASIGKPTDALNNFVRSAYVADSGKNKGLHEVVVVFDSVILRGNRAIKISTTDYNAFGSPNENTLGSFINKDVNISNSYRTWQDNIEKYAKPIDAPKLSVISSPVLNNETMFLLGRMSSYLKENDFITVGLFPGIQNMSYINSLNDDNKIKGMILLTYGSGNAPEKPEFLNSIKNVSDPKGNSVIDITQVHSGTVDIDHYKSGSALKTAGVISGFNLTPSAGLTKQIIFSYKCSYESKHDNKCIYDAIQTPILGDLNSLFYPIWEY